MRITRWLNLGLLTAWALVVIAVILLFNSGVIPDEDLFGGSGGYYWLTIFAAGAACLGTFVLYVLARLLLIGIGWDRDEPAVQSEE